MTSVNELVRQSILTFPSLHQSRSNVLHHALCVLGSGYEWDENGEAFADYDLPLLWTPELQQANNDHRDMTTYRSLDAEFLAEFHELDKQKMATCKKVVSEIEERILLVEPLPFIYPQCEGSLLMSIPDNATEEWLAACEEARALVEPHGWEFP